MKPLLFAAVLGAIAGPAAAEITARGEDGFSLSFERPLTAPDAAVLAALGRPADWWSDAHTYSGAAANLSVDLRPGGCWCEALPDGGVKHGETLMVWPDQRLVRFAAPFGPLQAMGADAVLTVSWTGGEGARRVLKWTFVVAGPGVGAAAEPVEAVIGEQFNRLADHLDRIEP